MQTQEFDVFFISYGRSRKRKFILSREISSIIQAMLPISNTGVFINKSIGSCRSQVECQSHRDEHLPLCGAGLTDYQTPMKKNQSTCLDGEKGYEPVPKCL
jgi:hypothetical protein